MKLIKAIVRPNKVDDVREALEKLNISGMTVTEVAATASRKAIPPSTAGRNTTSACSRRWRSRWSSTMGRSTTR